MTPLRPQRRIPATIVAGLLAVAATVAPAGIATAAPNPQPAGKHAPTPPAAGIITWAVQTSNAQGPDGRRNYSYLGLQPGSVIRDYVSVTNFSTRPATFQIYARAAYNDKTGRIQLQPAADKPRDVGSWIDGLKATVTLGPNERVTEPFTLDIPVHATPGDHVGGIIVSPVLDTRTQPGGPVRVDRRLALPINLRVAGPLHPGVGIESVSGRYHDSVNPFQGGSADLTYTVHNTGNVRLNLSQVVTAKGLIWLKLSGTHPAPLDDLVPGAEVEVTAHLTGVYPLGPMTVRGDVTPTEIDGLPTASTKPQPVAFDFLLWATPWQLIVVLLLLAGGFFGGRQLQRIRRRRQDRAIADAVAQARRETAGVVRQRAGDEQTEVENV